MGVDLKTKQWGEFFIEDIFIIKSGKRLTKAEMKSGVMPFIGASDSNNGITAYISNTNDSFDSNVLGVNYDGSVVENFYHPYKALFSDSVKRLSFKHIKGNKFLYLFAKSVILQQKSKYQYAYKFNEGRMLRQKILLPIDCQGEPDYLFMEQYMREKERQLVDKYKEYLSFKINDLELTGGGVALLDNKAWGEFFIEDIFHINAGKRLTKLEMKHGKTPFIGASDSNNGITAYVSNTNSSLSSNVLGVNYNGSVVENFYHPYKALFSDDVKRLSFKHVEGNEFVYLFAKSVILQQKNKYQYAYKFNEGRMSRQKVLLPINNQGEPDYGCMENYMKQLEYQKLSTYLARKKTIEFNHA